MARTTATPGPTAASMAAVVTPAAMDSTRVAPASAPARAAAGTSPGFTATTTPSVGGHESLTATPGNRARSSSTRLGTTSTTASSPADAHDAPRSPPRRASPMRPPPMMASRAPMGGEGSPAERRQGR